MADIQANTLKITIGDKTYIVTGGSGGGVSQSQIEAVVADYVNTHKDELKGDKGDTGETGPQGEQGERGPQGETGPAGTVNPDDVASEVTSQISALGVGTMAYRNLIVGSGEPDSWTGEDGDFYIQIDG